MKTVLIDSSSAILLFKSGLFDHLIHRFEVILSNSVYKELTSSAHAGSNEFKTYIQNYKITPIIHYSVGTANRPYVVAADVLLIAGVNIAVAHEGAPRVARLVLAARPVVPGDHSCKRIPI